MAFTLQPVERTEIPTKSRESKWRSVLDQFVDSGQEAARLSFDGEQNRDGEPITASSAQSGLSTARKAAEPKYDNVSVSQRGDSVYLVRKDMRAEAAEEIAEPSEDED